MASTSIFSTTTIESSSPCTSPINQQKQQATVPGFTQTPQVSALNLLAEDPFSTNTSKVLFEAIGMFQKALSAYINPLTVVMMQMSFESMK